MLGGLCRDYARRQAQQLALWGRALSSPALTWPPPQGVLDLQPELAASLGRQEPAQLPRCVKCGCLYIAALSLTDTACCSSQQTQLAPVQQSILELAQAVRKQRLDAPTMPALLQLTVR